MIFSLFAKSNARSNGILQRHQRQVLRIAKHVTYQTPLRCIGPILTTCRIFSLFKMPSRRPRVIPATLRSLVPLIMWLSAIRSANCLLFKRPGHKQSLGGEHERAYLPVWRHRHLSPQPENRGCPRLPIRSQSPEASSQPERVDRCCQRSAGGTHVRAHPAR